MIAGCSRAGCVPQISTEWEMNSENVTDWKLVDVPELGYYTTDQPFPRGELVLKTRSLISGYYKHPKVCTHHRGAAAMCAKPGACVCLGAAADVWLPGTQCWICVTRLRVSCDTHATCHRAILTDEILVTVTDCHCRWVCFAWSVASCMCSAPDACKGGHPSPGLPVRHSSGQESAQAACGAAAVHGLL